MALRPCTEIKGESTLRKDALRERRVRDALVIPLRRPRPPGVYDATGRLVLESVFRRGLPTRQIVWADPQAICHGPDAPWAPDGHTYVFAGFLAEHFGHFLFAILPRLWSLPRPVPPDLRLVVQNGYDVKAHFQLPFVRELLAPLGITEATFLPLSRPMRFRELIVPEPAFEENLVAHAAFKDLCHWLGKRLAADRERPSGAPIYLSKVAVTAGVHRIVNEADLCAALARRGFRIISPERLPVADQIALWWGDAPIAGHFGSLLHTSLFAPARAYVALNPEPWINSNQVLIDRLNGNRGMILYPEQGYVRREASRQFQHELELRDPVGAAADIECALHADA